MLENNTFKTLGQLFLAFSKISPITFGGGYAIIPSLEIAVVDRYKWLKKEDISDVFSIVQSIPGSVALNAAAFIGYRVAGIPGMFAASFGMILPTFLIVMALALSFAVIKDLAQVRYALFTVAPAVVALIFYAGLKTFKTSVVDKATLWLMAGILLLLILTPIHPIVILVMGGIIGGSIGWRNLRAKNQ